MTVGYLSFDSGRRPEHYWSRGLRPLARVLTRALALGDADPLMTASAEPTRATVPSAPPARTRPIDPRPSPGAPNVVVIILDDVGFAQLGCFGSDIATPNIDALADRRPALQPLPRHRDVLADARVRAHRPQPSRGRDGVPRRHADGVSRATRAALPKSVTAAAPRPARRGVQHARRSGSGTSCPRGERSHAGPFDRWPLGLRVRALLRVPPGRHEPVDAEPRPRQPLRRAARAATKTAITSPRTSPTRAIRYVARPAAGRAGQAVLPVLRDRARCTRRTTSRPSGWSPTAAASTAVGSGGAPRSSPARSRSAIVPDGTVLTERPSWVRGVGRRSPTTSGACTRGSRRCSPGFLTHTDAQIGRLARPARRDRRARQHARDADLRQRRERRGRRARHRSTSTASRRSAPRPSTATSRGSTSWAASAPTTTTRGAGRGRATRRCGCGSATRGSAAPAHPRLLDCPVPGVVDARRYFVGEQRAFDLEQLERQHPHVVEVRQSFECADWRRAAAHRSRSVRARSFLRKMPPVWWFSTSGYRSLRR